MRHHLTLGGAEKPVFVFRLASINPQRANRVHLPGLVIAPDDQQFLTRRGVPFWWVVVHAAIPHVHAIDNGISKGTAALNYSAAHGCKCRGACRKKNLDCARWPNPGLLQNEIWITLL